MSSLPQFKPSFSLKGPWTKTGKRIESQVRKALYDYEMIDGKKVAIALSGGKDSLALLLMLHAISGRGFPPFDLIAIHVGGPNSCGAGVGTRVLADVTQALSIPLYVLEQKKSEKELECYSCSRERRRLLFNCAKEQGANTIAFGHHRDDNAQTLMMNLLHKGEFAGLMPKIEMVDYGVTILRPLILCKEQEIIEFIKQVGLFRTVCQCPVGALSLRKEVDRILSDLEDRFPNVRDNLSQASLQYGSKKALRNERPFGN